MAQNSMNNSKKFGFIFDLDGTLIDSAGQIAKAVNRTRISWDLPALDFGEIHKNVGRPADSMFSDLKLRKDELVEIVTEFRQFLLEDIQISNEVYEDALKFVELLKRNGQFVAIATSKPTDLAIAVVENSKYAGLIDQIVGIGFHKPKPDPGMILEIMHGNNFDGGIMFGDRPEDITAAIDSGIPAIGLAQSVYSPDDLIRVGARSAFLNFTELMDEFEHTKDALIDYFR